MPALPELLRAAAGMLRVRLAAARRTRDAGYTTETVVVTALLVALAIAAIAIIVAKGIAKATGRNAGCDPRPPPPGGRLVPDPAGRNAAGRGATAEPAPPRSPSRCRC